MAQHSPYTSLFVVISKKYSIFLHCYASSHLQKNNKFISKREDTSKTDLIIDFQFIKEAFSLSSSEGFAWNENPSQPSYRNIFLALRTYG
jgi:hypothetical protein